MLLLADVVLNNEALVIVGAVSSSLAGALAFFWKIDNARRDRHEAEMRRAYDELLAVVVSNELEHQLPPGVVRTILRERRAGGDQGGAGQSLN